MEKLVFERNLTDRLFDLELLELAFFAVDSFAELFFFALLCCQFLLPCDVVGIDALVQ
ncbi:hypothetical protein D3C81_2146180 [compost metagenome]